MRHSYSYEKYVLNPNDSKSYEDYIVKYVQQLEKIIAISIKKWSYNRLNECEALISDKNSTCFRNIILRFAKIKCKKSCFNEYFRYHLNDYHVFDVKNAIESLHLYKFDEFNVYMNSIKRLIWFHF